MVLAGGLARRMGGNDKALLQIDGRPMIAYVLEALAPQVDAIIINANRNKEYYTGYGYPVVSDTVDGFAGPLAGVERGMALAETPYIITVPCDSPLLPTDLVSRLREALDQENAEVAMVHDGTRAHPVFALISVALYDSLTRWLASGERKVDRWYEQHQLAIADYSDHPECFINVNTPEDHDRLLAVRSHFDHSSERSSQGSRIPSGDQSDC